MLFHPILGGAVVEPVTTALVTALAAGAAAGLKDTAAQAVKDAYAKLKGLIRTRYPNVSIDQLEQQPTSKARQGVVGEDLERERASRCPWNELK
jgi:hypothetical protein